MTNSAAAVTGRMYRAYVAYLIRTRNSLSLFSLFDYQNAPAGPVNEYGVFYTSGSSI